MFKNLRIGTRFALASAMLCVLTAMLAGIAYWQIASLRGQMEEVPALIELRLAMAEWQGETAVNAARTAAILRSDDDTLGGHLAADMKASSARISELQKRIEALP